MPTRVLTAFRSRLLAPAILLVLAIPVFAADPAPPATATPATSADSAAGLPPGIRPLTPEEKIAQRFDTLTREYEAHLASPDWILRSLSVISIGRLPTPQATNLILKRFDSERHPVGRLVAWQAMLARAPLLTDDQFAAFNGATWQMVDQNLFSGNLRIGLLEMLSSQPISPRARDLFKKLFKDTNSLDSEDIPTLIAMGHALRNWGDAMLVDYLIDALANPGTCVRAELVLQAAGAAVPWTRTPRSRDVYADWWKTARQAFTANSPAPDARKSLQPQYLSAPVEPQSILDNPNWHDELELGRLELQNFDFAMAVDCSQSMAPEIERLKRDMAIMVAAFGLIAREPRVGITLFSPGGIVKCQPLTANTRELGAFLDKEGHIFGPGGDEEWAGALEQTITQSRWAPIGLHSRRFIVIMSDEPITRDQFARAWAITRDAARAQFKIYGVRIKPARQRNNPLSANFPRTGGTLPPRTAPAVKPEDIPAQAPDLGKASWQCYDELANATGAQAIDVDVPQDGWGLGAIPDFSALKPRQLARVKQTSPMTVAPLYPGGGPTARVLTMVLRDAINPQYADRVEPFAKIVVGYCQRFARTQPERRPWGQPDDMEPNK